MMRAAFVVLLVLVTGCATAKESGLSAEVADLHKLVDAQRDEMAASRKQHEKDLKSLRDEIEFLHIDAFAWREAVMEALKDIRDELHLQPPPVSPSLKEPGAIINVFFGSEKSKPEPAVGYYY
jgi:hypothetical protein